MSPSAYLALSCLVVVTVTGGWYEARLVRGAHPMVLGGEVRCRAQQLHHFWDEPWHPGRYVVRIKVAGRMRGELAEILAEHSAVEAFGEWDATPDERLYGELWPTAASFFTAASTVASVAPPGALLHVKLVHCYLNAQGLSPAQEARWALAFAWNRLRMVAAVARHNLRRRGPLG